MTGIVVSVEDMNVVVVEGGPKQQRHYKKLMLNRINWGEELVGQKKGVAKEEDEGQRNECTLVGSCKFLYIIEFFENAFNSSFLGLGRNNSKARVQH